MVRLRELAGVAGLAMLAMTVAMACPELENLQANFQPVSALRLASNEADAALHYAVDGSSASASGTDGQVVDLTIPDSPPTAQDDAANRLRSKIPSELYPYFDVYLYVSKASRGSLAQRMYVFHKGDANDLVFEQSFPVSTGRERHERYFTTTPVGLFELDPNRFERVHYSREWGGVPMRHAMFLDATIHGRQTGVALHSAGSHVAELGSRASGGCVRMPPAKAAELFNRFRREEAGMVPVFAYDASRRRTNGEGLIQVDDNGAPVLARGYRVLLFIENYEGGPALVAVLT